MNLRAGVTGLVLGLAAGAAAGFMAGRPGPPAQVAPGVPPSGATPPPAPAPEPAPDLTPAHAPAPRTLAEILAEIAPPPDAGGPGGGTIQGRVTTSEGLPLADLEVVASATGSPVERRPAPDGVRPLEDVVRDTVAEWHRTRSTRRSTRTDADGRYLFTGLADTNWRVMVHAMGYAVSTSDQRAWRGIRPHAVVDFTADRQIEVAVDVRLPDGSQPPQAEIVDLRHYSDNAAGRHTHDWSPGEPLRMMPGRHTVHAVVPDERDGVEYESPPVEVVVKPGQPVAPVTLRVVTKVGVRGLVTFPEDEVESSANVHLLRIAPGTTPSAERLHEDGKTKYAFGNSPAYEFDGIEPGTYAIGVSRGFRSPMVAVATVTVGTGLVTHDIVVPPLESGRHWIARVTGPDGAPVTDCDEFRVRMPDRPFRDGRFEVAVRKADHTYWLWTREETARPDGQGDVAANPLTLVVESKSLGVTEATLDAAKGNQVDVRYAPPATLTITLHGYTGDAMQRKLRVRVRPRGGEPKPDTFTGDRDALVDHMGRRVAGPLPPGDYDVVVSVEVFHYDELEALRHPVTLVAGENAVELAAPALHRVELSVPDPETVVGARFARLGATGRAAMGVEVEPDDRGRCVLEPVPAGVFRLVVVRGPGQIETMRVRVPTSGPVAFTPESVNALRAMIRDPSGTLGKAGLRDGDLIVAIGGKAFAGFQQLMELLAEGEQAGLLEFGVLRDGQPLTVRVPAMALVDPSKAGGGLEPETR